MVSMTINPSVSHNRHSLEIALINIRLVIFFAKIKLGNKYIYDFI